MFNRKKKEEQQKAAEAGRQAILQEFDGDIEAAAKLADPGERIIRLREIEKEVDQTIKDKLAGRNDAVLGREFSRGFSFFGAAAAVTIGLALCFHTGLLLFLFVPGIYGSFKVGGRSSDKLETRLYEENKTFFETLNAKKTKVSGLAAELVKTEWPAMAKSKKAKEILNAVPELREKFAAAFCKQLATGEIAVPPPPTSLEQQQKIANDKAAHDATVLEAPLALPGPLRLKNQRVPKSG